MKMLETWPPFEGNIEEIRRKFPFPLVTLAQGEVPALVLRGAYNQALQFACRALLRKRTAV